VAQRLSIMSLSPRLLSAHVRWCSALRCVRVSEIVCCSLHLYFTIVVFLKYARVQAINAVHPGVDAANCTVLSNGRCNTRA
jgi:hypothetical protein